MFVHNTEHVCVWQILTPRFQTTKKESNTDYLLFRFIFTGNKIIQKEKRISNEKIISLLETSNYIRTNI